jgi:hypothetical protein
LSSEAVARLKIGADRGAAAAMRTRLLVPLRPWLLPLGLAAAIAAVTAIPYAAGFWGQPHGRVFMGFYVLGDDQNTYLAKMRQGLEGHWTWVNRYTSESSPGIYFFLWWLALGHLVGLLHTSLMAGYQLARVLGAFFLLMAGYAFIREFVEDPRARRFAMWLLATGMGFGFVLALAGGPVIFGQPTTAEDYHMPELTAFYSILAAPHFTWAAAFQATAIVLTFRAALTGSLRLALLAAVAWFGDATIHAHMLVLLDAALVFALLSRPVSRRGYLAAGVAIALPAPYVVYNYWASVSVPEVLRWSSNWHNNFAPDGVSMLFAVLPQVALAALAIPAALRRRSRHDLFLFAWLTLVAFVAWAPNPASNLSRRFFDGIYLPLVVFAARGMVEQLLPRLGSVRRERLVQFGYVCVTAITSAFLVLAFTMNSHSKEYSLPRSSYDALLWLDRHPAGLVLASSTMGLYVPAYSPDITYVGQYSETYLYPQKAERAKRLLTGQDGDLADFIAQNRVNYVLWTDEFGGKPPAGLGPPAFYEPGAEVFAVRT